MPDRSRGSTSKGARRFSLSLTLIFSCVVMAIFLGTIEAGARFLLRVRYGPEAVPRLFETFSIPPKGPETIRIFFYGGSTTYGGHVPKAGFVNQTRVLLEKRFPQKKVEVWNFGLPGKDSTYVVRVMEKTVHKQPDLLVVYSAHNEFIEEGFGDSLGTRLRRLLDRLAAVKLARMVMQKLFHAPPPENMMRVQGIDRKSPVFLQKAQIYFRNLDTMVRLAAFARVPLILCTAISNLSDWPPVLRENAGFNVPEDYAALRAKAASGLDTGDLASARKALDEFVSRYPEDATAHFLLGRYFMATGQYPRAEQEFDLARDWDPVPWRVLDLFNRGIRERGSQEGVVVVDVDRLFRERNPNRLVGFPRISDNCHPDPLGNFWIASALVEAMQQEQVPPGIWQHEKPVQDDLEEVLREAGVTNEDRLHLFLQNALYSMKTPFCCYQAARQSLEEARLLAPEDWRIWANLGTVSLYLGDRSLAMEQLRRAAELRGSPLEVEDWQNTPYLKQALDKEGLSIKEILPPGPPKK